MLHTGVKVKGTSFKRAVRGLDLEMLMGDGGCVDCLVCSAWFLDMLFFFFFVFVFCFFVFCFFFFFCFLFFLFFLFLFCFVLFCFFLLDSDFLPPPPVFYRRGIKVPWPHSADRSLVWWFSFFPSHCCSVDCELVLLREIRKLIILKSANFKLDPEL